MGAMLAAMVLLQRFALPFGGRAISLVGPVGVAIAGVGLARGVLAVDRRRLVVFLALAGWIALGMGWQMTQPDRFGAAVNLGSLAQFLVLTGFGCLSMARPVAEARFLALLSRAMGWVALAGIAQFAAQFVGVRVFAFTGLLPGGLLYEAGYNLAIPVGIGGLLKANGFFLIEPSVFSQFMAVGVMAEFLGARRPARLALLLGALVLSFSGTGWLVLGAFLIAAPVGLGRRGVAITAGLALLAGLALCIGLVAAPSFAALFAERGAEIARIGTSGHLRFVTPFWLLGDVLRRAPSAWLFGIGSGASEALYLPYAYTVNTPVKVLLEYGAPALVAYLAFFLCGGRSPAQRALLVPVLVLFLFGGGYQQFPPVLFLVLLLLCIARLDVAPSQGARA